MRVGRWRLGPLRRRFAPVLVVLVAGGTMAGVQAAVSGTPGRGSAAAQTLEAPTSPTEYEQRGVTGLLATVNAFSSFPQSTLDMSEDGRYVVFDSLAPLVDELPNDVESESNGYLDVYMIDRDIDGNGVYDEPLVDQPSPSTSLTSPTTSLPFPPPATITWISQGFVPGFFGPFIVGPRPGGGHGRSRAQQPSQDGSFDPAISPNGRFVVFASDFNNPPNFDDDDNTDPDVFRWDREDVTAPAEPVTIEDEGSEFLPAETGSPSVGDNGNVAFQETRTSTGTPTSGTTTRVFVRRFAAEEAGAAVPDYSQPLVVLADESDDLQPELSGDGNRMVYIARDDPTDGTFAPDELAIFDVADPATARILPRPTDPNTSSPFEPVISYNGSVVAYTVGVEVGDVLIDQVYVNDDAVPGVFELVSQAGGNPGDDGQRTTEHLCRRALRRLSDDGPEHPPHRQQLLRADTDCGARPFESRSRERAGVVRV